MQINKQNKISISSNIKENYQYKVSIIVPCYNTKPWLDECLQSLVDQTLQEIEIICVNDGSTDGTGERLDEWQTQYPDKIKVIHQQNGGLSNARNAGMAIAQGECIGFVDSDDFVDICMYEKLYKVLTNNNTDVVKCHRLNFIKLESVERSFNNSIGRLINFTEIFDLDLSVWGGVYTKKFLQQYNIKFINNIFFGEDTCFSYELAMHNPVLYLLEDKLYYYRQQRKNQLTSYNGKNVYNYIKIFEVLFNKTHRINLDNSVLINKIMIRKQVSKLFSYILTIECQYKKDFLFRSSNSIFQNNKILTIYKCILSSRYANPVNYFMAPIVVVLFHCCYLLQKLPFVKLKNFDDLD